MRLTVWGLRGNATGMMITTYQSYSNCQKVDGLLSKARGIVLLTRGMNEIQTAE